MWARERINVYDKYIAEFPVRCWFTTDCVASSIFSHIRTKNYVRLAPAGGCGYNPRETSYGTGTWWVMWKTGIPVGFMGWSRVTSDRPRRVSPGEGQSQAHCRGPLPLKKTRDRPTGTTHAESLTSRADTRTMDGSKDQNLNSSGFDICLEKIPLFGAPLPSSPPPRLPLGGGMPKISRGFPLPTRWRNIRNKI